MAPLVAGRPSATAAYCTSSDGRPSAEKASSAHPPHKPVNYSGQHQRLYVGGIDPSIPSHLTVPQVLKRVHQQLGGQLRLSEVHHGRTYCQFTATSIAAATALGKPSGGDDDSNSTDAATATTSSTPAPLELLRKHFHNVVWMGCKLRVEPARPNFLDRLADERAERAERAPSSEEALRPLPPPSESNASAVARVPRHLTLRLPQSRSRGCDAQPTLVSTRKMNDPRIPARIKVDTKPRPVANWSEFQRRMRQQRRGGRHGERERGDVTATPARSLHLRLAMSSEEEDSELLDGEGNRASDAASDADASVASTTSSSSAASRSSSKRSGNDARPPACPYVWSDDSDDDDDGEKDGTKEDGSADQQHRRQTSNEEDDHDDDHELSSESNDSHLEEERPTAPEVSRMLASNAGSSASDIAGGTADAFRRASISTDDGDDGSNSENRDDTEATESHAQVTSSSEVSSESEIVDDENNDDDVLLPDVASNLRILSQLFPDVTAKPAETPSRSEQHADAKSLGLPPGAAESRTNAAKATASSGWGKAGLMLRYDPNSPAARAFVLPPNATPTPADYKIYSEDHGTATSPTQERPAANAVSEAAASSKETAERADNSGSHKSESATPTSSHLYDQSKLEAVFREARGGESIGHDGNITSTNAGSHDSGFAFSVPLLEVNRREKPEAPLFAFSFALQDSQLSAPQHQAELAVEDFDAEPSNDNEDSASSENRPSPPKKRSFGQAFTDEELDSYIAPFLRLSDGFTGTVDQWRNDEALKAQWVKERAALTQDWKRKRKAAVARKKN